MNAPYTLSPKQRLLVACLALLWIFIGVGIMLLLINDGLSFYFATEKGKFDKLCLQTLLTIITLSTFMAMTTLRKTRKLPRKTS